MRTATIARAATAYLLPVYALGWVLGPLRELVAIPRLGRTAATAAEAAIMASASAASARAANRRLGDGAPASASLALGALAFAIVAVLEAGTARAVRRMTLREYARTFRTPSGALSAAAFAWFAVAPLAVRSALAATAAERGRALPGDELIDAANASLTHAITIRGTRADVWPWLVQMGAGRAGWYSYDVFDNGGRPSARRIVAELQHPAVGSIFPWTPGATEGFTLLRLDVERALVLGWVPPGGGTPKMTWAFVLEDAGPGRTRLVVRARVGAVYDFFGMPRLVGDLVGPVVHGIMQRRQLRGIARRVERAVSGGGSPT